MYMSTFSAKSIKQFIPIPGWDSSEAYLYEYRNILNGMIYLGVHKIEWGEVYYHSSTNKVFNKLTSGSEPIFTLKILQYGKYTDMHNEEHRLLSEVDAKNNPNYYNLSNSNPTYRKKQGANRPYMLELLERFKAGEFNKGKMDKNQLNKYEKFQCRTKQFDNTKVSGITEMINRAGGNTDECEPVFIFKWKDAPEGMIIGGNHTIRACIRAKNAHATPYAEFEDLHVRTIDIKSLANLLNRRDKTISSPSENAEIADILHEEKIADVRFDFKGSEALKIMEEHHIFLKKDKKEIVDIAEKNWEKYRKRNSKTVRIEYAAKEEKENGIQEAENYVDRDTTSFMVATGRPDSIHVGILNKLKNTTKQKVVVCYYCTSDELETKFDDPNNKDGKAKLTQYWNDMCDKVIQPVTIDGIEKKRQVIFRPLTSHKLNPNYKKEEE